MSSGLARYAAARAVRAAITIAGVVVLAFTLVRMTPGDPADVILGDTASPEEKAEWRAQHGTDLPLGQQFLRFVGGVVDGTLERSWRDDATVTSRIASQLPSTLALALASLLVAWLLAVPLGSLAAVFHRRPQDGAIRAFAVVGLAMPTIWLGPLLILFFGMKLGWFPLPGSEAHPLVALVLPAFTIGTALAASLTRQTRGSMIEVLRAQYVIAARARGLSATVVVLKHALRNALMPVLTVGAAQLGALLVGAVVTERIFERPGLGSLMIDGFFQRDLPVVQGCTLVFALMYVAVNLGVDLLYGVIDPRVRIAA